MEFSTSQVDEEFSNNDELYNGVYRGPAYEFTSSVTNFKRLPRWDTYNMHKYNIMMIRAYLLQKDF